MSNVLVIVESPAKAKTIGKFLGKKYTVKSSMGHIRDLPKSQMGVDIENGFKPKYITIRGKGELLKELKAAAKKSKKVLLATDPDREGEAIAWHLQQVLGIDEHAKCRIEFNEITKNAVLQALEKPREIDFNRVDAQQARRVLDRLVGYGLSPLLWKKVRKGLSAGRVQSVAVRLIYEREKEINQFVPEEYWSLTAFLLNKPQGKLEAKLQKKGNESIKISSKAEMDRILEDLKDKDFVITSIIKKEKKRNPSAPFTTSSLQQEAYRKLGFTARKTMMIAQQLYEGIDLGNEGAVGLITYLRTDSTRVAAVAQEEARNFIAQNYGEEYLPPKAREYATNKQAQNAHEAIRPTAVSRTPESLEKVLTKDQYKLYKLIWERFIASQMSSAVLDTTTVIINAGEYEFRANGSILKFPGYMKVYTESKETDAEEEGKILPDLVEGTILSLQKLEPKQHFTQPPPRYTEATLVKTLEELGIGRPSTYAPIIETILQRGYVIRENKQFIPTELGAIVVELLKEHFPDIIDVEFTAKVESNLDSVEEGEQDWQTVVSNFYEPFAKKLEQAEKEIGEIEIADELSDEVCEKCGRTMVIKMGRYGKFLACPGFPDCRNTKPLLEELDVCCPQCGGKIVLRKTKKGRKFYGCKNYPDCDFVSWDKPTAETCPQCQSMLVEKTGKNGSQLVCSSKDCNYQKQCV